MKVTTDACLFGAWCAEEIKRLPNSPQHLLDIGAGTGLLSLMVAQKNDKVQIDAIEIDSTAAEQAKENVTASPWTDRIHIVNENVVYWKIEKKYDCIVSNPPFYESELRSDTQLKNMAHHDEGLKFTDLIRTIHDRLSEEGMFFLLLPAKREDEVERIIKENGFYLIQKLFVRQSPLHKHFRIVLQAGRKEQPVAPITSEIAIKREGNEYTSAFIALLKDYYLYL